MNELRFEWDPRKGEANHSKHDVDFLEAQSVFLDEYAVEFFDPDHSDDEDRFIMLGMSSKPRVLVVCHCLRESEAIIRLISARRATRLEQAEYWRRRA